MPGLRELADVTGVSIRTVSRVLKGERYVRAEVRARVLDAAARLGYRPDRRARSLKSGTGYEVLALAWSTDELHVAKMAGLEECLRDRDMSLSIAFDTAGRPAERVEGFLAEAVSRRPAGVVLFSPGRADCRALVRPLAKRGIPYVVLDATDPAVDSVRIDRPRGVHESVHYLARRGRKRIGYVGPRQSSRLDGYRRALSELGRKGTYIDIKGGAEHFDNARAAARSYVRRGARADAVQAYSDVVALGFLAGLHDEGVRVPDDIAVVGFDDRRAASASWPKLTTVAQPNHDVGRQAAEVLLAKVAGEPPPSGGWSRMLPTRLVVRESA